MRKKNNFGKAFSDNFKKVTSKNYRYHKADANENWQDALMSGEEYSGETEKLNPWRKTVVAGFLLVILFLLVGRLFHLQVVEGSRNRELADSNRIKVKIIHAPRGVIYDRNGKILAQNEPNFRLVESSGSSISVRYIDRDEAMKMEIDNDPKYQNLEIDTKRSYPFGEKTAHILGYIGEITGDELKDTQYKNYRLGDKIGRSGVEESYEKILKGVSGAEIIEVDAQGRKLRTLRVTPAIPGQNLYLSIDIDMQVLAYNLLSESLNKTKTCCGAVVAQNPNNGEIMSLVSLPSYDPTDIANSLVTPNSPFLNRAIGGTYPPGSTFKIISSLAGLTSGKITSQTKFEDTGVMKLGSYSFANWYYTSTGKTEGSVDVVKALYRSNDIYFYNLGNIIGEKAIGDYAEKMGYGQKTGIDIPGEETGLIPDNNWKLQNIGEPWYPGDTLHMSIGQGYLLVTPLQVSNMMCTVATNGKQYPPHLAMKITDPDGKLIKTYKYDPMLKNFIKQEYLDVVKHGLSLVPKSGGSAWPLFNFPIPTSGKTGTAETGDPIKTHAWYTSFGKNEHPELSVTVLIEYGGQGSSVSSPIARDIYKWYFSEDKSSLPQEQNTEVSTEDKKLGE